MTDVTLMNGDCLELMPTLPPQSVQMVFADLPYASKYRKTTDCTWDTTVPLKTFWAAVWPVLDGPFIATSSQPFTSILIASNVNKFRYDIVWRKTNIGGWFNANRQPLRAHEHIAVFSEKMPPYNPQMTADKSYKIMNAATAKAFQARQRNTSRIPTISNGLRYPLSVQIFNRCKDAGMHPTQKPIALLEWLIKTYTNPGDTVLDPVAGSGTTAIAAMRTGRRAICIEKDATYFAAMTKRVEDERARMVQAPLAI